MSTAESYSNRAEAGAATAYDRVIAEGEKIEETTAVAHAEATDFVSPIATRDEISRATAASDYPSSSKEDRPPPIEPDVTPNIDYEVENEEDADIDEEADDANEEDGADPPILTSPYQEDSVFIDARAMPILTHPLKNPSTRPSTG